MLKYSYEQKLEAVHRVVNDGKSVGSNAKILGTGYEHVRR